MTYSGLAKRRYNTSQKSSRNGTRIDMVICHHAATTNIEGVIQMEVSGSRQVSSNYAIGRDGEIIGVVPEEFRAWTSGSSSDGGKGAGFDRRAITFECADESLGGSWPISAASQEAIVNLLVDVHQRYGIPLDRDHIVGHRELWTRHRASYPTACPGGMNVDDLVNRARKRVGQAAVAPVASSGSNEVSGRNYTSRPTAEIQRLVGANPDGAYGPDTTRKVVAWQKANGLNPDGDWGPLSDAKGFGGKPAPKPSGATSAPAFPLPRGSYFGPKSGPAQSVSGYYSHQADLARFQQKLHDRGWTIGVDGLYGPNTQQNVVEFQREKGLEPDGLIGPDTWAAAWTSPVT
jgi:N-acetyl-anhydromuramyl-L-alanine amidase AmpD